MIENIIIKKLFNIFDYNIEMNNRKLIIITGPNGYGKSTILKILEAVNKLNLSYFYDINFDEIILKFKNDRKELTLKKVNNELFINGESLNSELENLFNEEFEDINISLRNKLLFKRNFFKNGNSNESPNEIEYFKNLFKRYSAFDNFDVSHTINNKFININGIKTFLNNKEEVYFIKEQRLLKPISISHDNDYISKHPKYSEIKKNKLNKITEVIDSIPNKIKNIINELSQKYSKVANELDSSYPSRLFETTIGLKEDEFKLKIIDIKKKFNNLNSYDISDVSVAKDITFKAEHAKALKIYFDDFDKKYNVYAEILKKFDLFMDIINNKLSFKKIKISEENGLSIVDMQGNNIKLSMLSSGEKQMIVLFYNLIFEIKNESLLLMDEPEISLHITWQQEFMRDVLRVLNSKNINVIIATHSPQILSNYWDHQIDLGEIYEK